MASIDWPRRLAVLNHDLRTPLAAMTAITDALKHQDLPAGTTQRLYDHLTVQVILTTHIIDVLSELGKIETGEYRLVKGEAAFSQFQDEFTLFQTPLSRQKSLIFTFNLPAAIQAIALQNQSQLLSAMKSAFLALWLSRPPGAGFSLGFALGDNRLTCTLQAPKCPLSSLGSLLHLHAGKIAELLDGNWQHSSNTCSISSIVVPMNRYR